MRIDINDSNKILAIWTTNQENSKTDIQKKLEQTIEKYKKQKYKICIYQSGKDNIKSNLLDLILNNAN